MIQRHNLIQDDNIMQHKPDHQQILAINQPNHQQKHATFDHLQHHHKSHSHQAFTQSKSLILLLSIGVIASLLIISISYRFRHSSAHLQHPIHHSDSAISKLQTLSTQRLLHNTYEQTTATNQNIVQIENTNQYQQVRRNLNKVQNKAIITAKQQHQQIQAQSSSDFIIPRQVWMFDKTNPTYLEELMIANNRRFTSLSNFKFNNLSLSNYHIFLSTQATTKVKLTLRILKERMHKGDPAIAKMYESIQRHLILISILYEKGGIILQGPLTITQTFDWLRQIKSNIYVNRGNPNAQPQVVGFYSPYYSSINRKQQKLLLPEQQQVQKYMIIIPALQSYFIAAKPKSDFIAKVLNEMIDILAFPQYISKDIQENKYSYLRLGTKDIYYLYSFMAVYRVLEDKQKSLDRQNKNTKIRTFAIDHYGLFAINCYYGPYKAAKTYEYILEDRKIRHLSQYDIDQYYENVGPTRYLQMPTFAALEGFLNKIKLQNLPNKIMNGSYLQKMYFPEATQPFIYSNIQKPIKNQKNIQWNTLPKIIWIFWDSGVANAPIQVILCVDSLKRMGALSGFELRQVNDSNIAVYLDPITIQSIQNTLKNAKMKVFPQTKSDLYRLALLYRHGGVYVDASTVAIQNFDWLINIAQYPSQFIFNRYGQLPNVLMFWNPNDGGVFQWQVDYQARTKKAWRFCLENSAIVAVQQSQFLKDWFNLYFYLLNKQPVEVSTVFDKCNITAFKRTSINSHYLLAMDAAICAVGQKQVWINKQAKTQWKNGMDYYKLWSMSAYLGPFKIWDHMNYDLATDKPFFTRHSQDYVQSITGKMRFFLKFQGLSRKELYKFIEQNYDKLQEQSHSQSLFMRYLFDPKKYRFEKSQGKILLKKLSG